MVRPPVLDRYRFYIINKLRRAVFLFAIYIPRGIRNRIESIVGFPLIQNTVTGHCYELRSGRASRVETQRRRRMRASKRDGELKFSGQRRRKASTRGRKWRSLVFKAGHDRTAASRSTTARRKRTRGGDEGEGSPEPKNSGDRVLALTDRHRSELILARAMPTHSKLNGTSSLPSASDRAR